MKKIYFKLQFYFLICLMFTQSNPCFAWGNRGHAVICEAAVHLVKNEELKYFLLHRTLALTYLCNIPDIYWRKPEFSKTGDATHHISTDLAGVSLEDTPTTYSEFIEKFKGKTNIIKNTPIYSIPQEIGTLWWRADQFVQRAIENGKKAKTLDLPPKAEERSDVHSYNLEIFAMLVNMGVLGHFVGDNAQPMHTTSNYDGWQNGHGGLHAYYEETTVSQLSPKLLSQVVLNAKIVEKELKLKKYSTVPEKMKSLSILSYKDMALITKLDPIIEPSKNITDKGMEIRTPAKRRSPKEGAKAFEKTIIKHMSRAAVLLANLWEDIYIKSNQPNLEVAKFYKFPHTPDFVKPDYTGE